MKRVLIRLATAVAASCGLITGSLALPAAAATPTPARTEEVIVIPGPDQVTDTFDAAPCPWRMAYAAAVTESLTKVSNAASHSMTQTAGPSYEPLVATLCAVFGR